MPRLRFTLRDLFLAMTLFCVAAAAFSQYWRQCSEGEYTIGLCCFIACFAFAAAGVGAIFHKPFDGALFGLGLVCLVWIVLDVIPTAIQAWRG